MNAKGTFFLGRKHLIISRYGESAWASFIKGLAEREPVFARPVMATTQVPLAAYIRFQEECIASFFNGDINGYWVMGEESGGWALTEGPYKHFRQNTIDLDVFVEKNLPRIWSSYFTEGELITYASARHVEGEIVRLPEWHISFEYTVMGFMRRALVLAGAEITSQLRLKGVSMGDKAIHYKFFISR